MQKYKIFYNNVRLIVVKHESSYLTETSPENCFFFDSSQDITILFEHFLDLEQDLDLLYEYESEDEQIMQALCDFFIFQRAAGGIVFKDKSILSIFRNNRWDFPKGHIEANETDADAALREVTEETGIDNLTIEKDLDYTYHVYKNEDNQFVLKETHWYQMRTSSDKTLVPQTEEGISAVKWIPFSQRKVVVENTYPAIVELLKKCGCKK